MNKLILTIAILFALIKAPFTVARYAYKFIKFLGIVLRPDSSLIKSAKSGLILTAEITDKVSGELEAGAISLNRYTEAIDKQNRIWFDKRMADLEVDRQVLDLKIQAQRNIGFQADNFDIIL